MKELNIAITGIGYLSPDGFGKVVFDEQILRGFEKREFENFDPHGFLEKKGLRFIPKATQMYCNLAFQCIQQNNLAVIIAQTPDRVGLYDGSELANIEDALLFDLVAKVDGPDYVSPMKAPNTLANSSASYAAIKSGIKGPNVSLSGGAGGCLQALDMAALHLTYQIIDHGIVVSTEVASHYHEAIRRGKADTKGHFYAVPLGISFNLSRLDDALTQRQPILALIQDTNSGQKMDFETAEQTFMRVVEPLLNNNIGEIMIGGLNNIEPEILKGLIRDYFPKWQGTISFPEKVYGISENSSSGLNILYALQQKEQATAKTKGQTILIASIDSIGYINALTVTI